MRIYRFRVLIDHPSEAFRDIEIGSDQTFLDLHKAIKDAFAFIGQEMACFYVSDEEWGKGPEIPLADMGFAEEGTVPALMDQVYISDHIRGTNQRFVYAYDFLHMWMFMVELIHAGDPEKGVSYPQVVMTMGNAPDEHSKEDDLNAGILAEDPYALDDEEHHYDDDDEFGSEEEEGEDHNEFGHGSEDHGEEFR
ncbi:MAG: hypothetical protein JNL43_04555 [Flavobacteriales bacterium]|nr:hypothetical protein [Flavobacteriales bacterium]HRH70776.1 hypothetical protein [Flavobacteriales bacterium]